jgi:EAL domain-containing protein (putative c-di-GMP-specific phosphodiesterase class I)
VGVVAYARRLGIRAIAEGLEDAETLGVLTAGADLDVAPARDVHGAQGFLLGRPSADALDPAEHRRTPGTLGFRAHRPD